MARTIAIGIQDFEQIITNDYFYVDKTAFIKSTVRARGCDLDSAIGEWLSAGITLSIDRRR